MRYTNRRILYVYFRFGEWRRVCHIMEPMRHSHRQRRVSSSSPGGGTRVKLLSTIAGLFTLLQHHARFAHARADWFHDEPHM